MQQRQPRVGDIVDDYCPRERRVSDHAVVAMVEDEIRQTRCTTCDTEHDYRQGKVPPGRKKGATVLPPKPPASAVVAPKPPEAVEVVDETTPAAVEVNDARAPAVAESPGRAVTPPAHEGHVHRRLIRAVLPRIEGEVPARPVPEFTMHRAAAGTRPPHGKPDRAAHGGPPRLGAKGGHGQPRHTGPRHDGGGAFGNTRGRGGPGAPGGNRGPGGRGGHTGPGGHRSGRPPGGGRGPGGKH